MGSVHTQIRGRHLDPWEVQQGVSLGRPSADGTPDGVVERPRRTPRFFQRRPEGGAPYEGSYSGLNALWASGHVRIGLGVTQKEVFHVKWSPWRHHDKCPTLPLCGEWVTMEVVG